MTQPKPKGRGTLQKKKAQPTPQEWLDFVTELRRIRVERGISSHDVADKIGITISNLSAWETGGRTPHPHDLVAWMATLELGLRVGYKS